MEISKTNPEKIPSEMLGIELRRSLTQKTLYRHVGFGNEQRGSYDGP